MRSLSLFTVWLFVGSSALASTTTNIKCATQYGSEALIGKPVPTIHQRHVTTVTTTVDTPPETITASPVTVTKTIKAVITKTIVTSSTSIAEVVTGYVAPLPLVSTIHVTNSLNVTTVTVTSTVRPRKLSHVIRRQFARTIRKSFPTAVSCIINVSYIRTKISQNKTSSSIKAITTTPTIIHSVVVKSTKTTTQIVYLTTAKTYLTTALSRESTAISTITISRAKTTVTETSTLTLHTPLPTILNGGFQTVSLAGDIPNWTFALDSEIIQPHNIITNTTLSGSSAAQCMLFEIDPTQGRGMRTCTFTNHFDARFYKTYLLSFDVRVIVDNPNTWLQYCALNLCWQIAYEELNTPAMGYKHFDVTIYGTDTGYIEKSPVEFSMMSYVGQTFELDNVSVKPVSEERPF